MSNRKSAAEISDLCKERGAQVLGVFIDIMLNSKSDTARLRAAENIWDRAYGNQKGETETGEQLSALPTPERIRVLEAALQAEKEKLSTEIAVDLSLQ